MVAPKRNRTSVASHPRVSCRLFRASPPREYASFYREGIKYFLLPRVSEEMPLSEIILAAMGQMFFSLSLGMGTLITYGSYLSKENDLIKSTFTIVILDTLIALIAGLVIIPSAYAFGGEISAGAGMIFETLPAVYAKIIG